VSIGFPCLDLHGILQPNNSKRLIPVLQLPSRGNYPCPCPCQSAASLITLYLQGFSRACRYRQLKKGNNPNRYLFGKTQWTTWCYWSVRTLISCSVLGWGNHRFTDAVRTICYGFYHPWWLWYQKTSTWCEGPC
jgi:hypothetical protein